MIYYHVFIDYTNKERKKHSIVYYNLSEEEARETIATPFMKNKRFWCLGKIIHPSDVYGIAFFWSEKRYRELILPNGKSPIGQDIKYIRDCFWNGKVEGAGEYTFGFITSLPEERETPIETPTKIIGKKEKVFIVHGRDETQALRLQKYLSRNLKIKAEMFEDFREKSGSNTIIEQLEYIKDNVGYAFIIATPDDYGCLREEMEKLKKKMLLGKESLEVEKVCKMLEHVKTRARQNVVFEFGLFIGALGRDRVCCLLKKDIQEKPSDVDGILYVDFDKSVKDTFTEITEKLKKAGLIKT